MAGSSFRYAWTAAEIRWGYHVAAALTGVELSVSEAGDRVEARVAHADPFRCAQTPLVFRVDRSPAPPWRWPIASLTIAGDTCTAILGDLLEE
jgi:hypothetical protein